MREEIRQWLNPRSAGARLALVFVVATVLHYATLTWNQGMFLFSPNEVIRGLKLWQLVTYVFISDPSPLSVIFGVLILVSMGSLLESYWGARRLWIFAVVTAAASAAATVPLSLVVPRLGGVHFPGGPLLTTEVWVAYGLVVGRGRSNFWGIPASGNALAAIGAGFILLYGVMASWIAMVPSLFSLVFTFLYVRLNFPTALFERFGSWRLRRQLNKRTKQLTVVSGGQRNMPGDSDKYLH